MSFLKALSNDHQSKNTLVIQKKNTQNKATNLDDITNIIEAQFLNGVINTSCKRRVAEGMTKMKTG